MGHAPVVRRTLIGVAGLHCLLECMLLLCEAADLRRIRRNLAIKVTRLSQPSEIRLWDERRDVTEIGGAFHDRYESWNNATSEESMVNDAVQRGMLLRVGCEDLLNKLTRVERDIVEREPVAIIVDVPERGRFQLRM
jgi:hypothetical protein